MVYCSRAASVAERHAADVRTSLETACAAAVQEPAFGAAIKPSARRSYRNAGHHEFLKRTVPTRTSPDLCL